MRYYRSKREKRSIFNLLKLDTVGKERKNLTGSRAARVRTHTHTAKSYSLQTIRKPVLQK